MIFNTCGNHDLYQGHWDNWKDACYPHTSFYKFQTSGFSWYALDTASGRICPNQFNLLKEEISKDPKPKVIFTHYPLTEFRVLGIGLDETTERNLLIDLFAKNNVLLYENCYERHNICGKWRLLIWLVGGKKDQEAVFWTICKVISYNFAKM